MENSDVFDEIARNAHAQNSASNANFLSNLGIACADHLNPEEMEFLVTHHREQNNKVLSLTFVEKSQFIMLSAR